MSRNITPIASTDTVEEWFNKTNLIIDAVQDAVTIGEGELNEGDVVISGNLSSTTIATSEINLIDVVTETLPINAGLVVNSGIESPLVLNGETSANANGQKIAFSFEDIARWTVGVASGDYNTFQIKNEDLNYSLSIETNASSAGTLTGTNVVIDKSLLPDIIDSNTTGDAGTCTRWKNSRKIEFATGDITGSFTLDGSSDVGNIVLNVKDNSHKHEVSNIDGLTEALNNKLESDPALDSIRNLGNKFGILVRTSKDNIEPKVLKNGDGIIITNAGGVSGTPTIAHADTSSVESTENNNPSYIQNIGFDAFGHVVSVSSANVPMSRTYVTSEKSISGGATTNVSHGLGGRPVTVEGYLICKTNDAGYVIGDMISLGSADTSDITVFANATRMGFRCKNSVVIRVVNDKGQLVAINNNNWRVVVKGVI